MPNPPRSTVLFAMLLAACGSSGGGDVSSAGSAGAGEVVVVFDARSGDDALAELQLVGATLEGPGGLATQNLLSEPRMLLVSDPTGSFGGFALEPAPTADYRALHLLFTPGSGIVLDASGEARSLAAPVDVRVPIADGLRHSAAASSWLVVGHDAAGLVAVGDGYEWHPALSARADEQPLSVGGMIYPVERDGDVFVTASRLARRSLRVAPLPDCAFRDDAGNTYASLAELWDACQPDPEWKVRGYYCRDGHVDADEICCCGGRQPRLIGRILALDQAQATFTFRVQAINPRGHEVALQAPEDIVVRTDSGVIARPNGDQLAFAELAVGQLAKVEWSTRTVVNGEVVDYVADRVVVPHATPRRQWSGRVMAVDPGAHTFVLAPMGNAPLRVLGEPVAEAQVAVGPDVAILRRVPGQGHVAITLSELEPGVDRVFVRGVATAPATIAAVRVRVRAR